MMRADGRQAPGPKGEPILGNARAFQADILAALQQGRQSYGDVVRFTGIGPLFPVFFVAHPDHVKHVLQDKHKNYPKTPFVNDRWRSLVGEGLICTEGDFWRRQRRLAQPAFHHKLIEDFATMMANMTGDMLGRWQLAADSGDQVNITSEITRLALRIVGQACFAADWEHDSETMERAVHIAISETYRKFENLVNLPENIPTPANLRFRAAKAELDKIIYRVIENRRCSDDHPADLLNAMMMATEDDGSGMTTEQLRNEVMTFMFGGHETTAVSLTWSLVLLSRHPVVARRLAAEVDEVLGGRTPTVADLPALTYLDCVARESLRLYPPVPLTARTPNEDDDIGGYRIPAGSMVLLSPFITHRHPDFWPNPEGFDPDRWTDGKADDRHRYSWWPFSAGPRKCIGEAFGMQELKLVIAMIIQRFQVGLVPGQPVLPKRGLTLGQQQPVMATLIRRGATAAAEETSQ
jgi:cytochrome P450